MESEASIIHRVIAAAKQLGCPERECPCCQAVAGFARHDKRRRQVLVIVGSFVVTCMIILVRWKCCSCQATFTHYPEFLVPYKRYLLAGILSMSERYVTEPEASYRKVVEPQGTPLGYADDAGGRIDERQLSHTTLWRWLSWLGGLSALTDQATDLLRQKDPGFALHRAVTPIAPAKYRSTKRRHILANAASLIQTGTEFLRFFSRRIFPTLCNRVLLRTS